ncbi:MAG: hypothetical protein K8S13_06870 [Desulfobacula sp.]|uniref:hypothetical protein n=1 Tax=Desulfobacula sp. TaxID=2593537 RepID=UPI0025BBAE6B|nr:hypothetical protein [Desulfobacula sp.]MCD4719569.1 hypothetical protein [Desulfobacula sp.]
MSPLFMSLLLIVGLAVFGRTMYYKILLLMALEPTSRTNHIKERLKNMVILAMGQKRLVGRKKGGLAGLCNALFSGDFGVRLFRSRGL